MTPSRAFALDLPWHLIQSVRLAHALMETSYRVHVPEAEAPKFAYLKEFFDLSFATATDGMPVLDPVILSHEKPETGVGSLTRPLVFPHGIVRTCRDRWQRDRDVHVSFCGLITPQRTGIIESWIARAGIKPTETWQRTRAQRLLRKKIPLVVSSSRRGRTFPVKAWDGSYFDLLATSEFVLCPNGDFVWTYRFFESALCGAIPIIEDHCSLYDGFVFATMEDAAPSLRWSPDAARQNHERAVALLTIPPDELEAELASLCR